MFVKIFAQETDDFRMIDGNAIQFAFQFPGIQRKVLAINEIMKVEIDVGMAHDEDEEGISDVPHGGQVRVP
jgi:hypothetical protein